jgi:hypothetical protein
MTLTERAGQQVRTTANPKSVPRLGTELPPKEAAGAARPACLVVVSASAQSKELALDMARFLARPLLAEHVPCQDDWAGPFQSQTSTDKHYLPAADRESAVEEGGLVLDALDSAHQALHPAQVK